MVEWGRERLGISAQTALFAEADLPAQLDAVTMWDYIEHSTNPRGDLAAAARNLRPGGVLALSTGDAGAPTARLAGRRWHLLTPEHHNFFFEKPTLRRLLEGTGFQVIEERRRSGLYSAGHVLYKLAALTSLRPLRSCAAAFERSRLASVALPLNLFDIVTVVARRVA
jgi:SAM-dependent methyltransferase